MHEFAQAPATLVFDDFVRVYFSCRPAGRRQRPVRQPRRLRRSQPRQPLRDAGWTVGATGLDLGGLGAFDEFGTYPTSVIRTATRSAPTTAAGRAACRCRSTSPSATRQPRRRRHFREAGPRPGARPRPARAVRDQRPQDSPVRRAAGTSGTSPAPSGFRPTAAPSRSIGSAWRRRPTAGTWGRQHRELIAAAARGRRVPGQSRRASSRTASTTCSSAIATASAIADARGATVSATPVRRISDLDPRRRQGGPRRFGRRLGLGDDQLSARLRTRRQDLMFYLGNQVGRHGFGLAELEGVLA